MANDYLGKIYTFRYFWLVVILSLILLASLGRGGGGGGGDPHIRTTGFFGTLHAEKLLYLEVGWCNDYRLLLYSRRDGRIPVGR